MNGGWEKRHFDCCDDGGMERCHSNQFGSDKRLPTHGREINTGTRGIARDAQFDLIKPLILFLSW